ncbi:hypothetical protein LWI29_019763 [Acer saccharum]|uniref:Zinc finger, CCHC-type n=1 Tax=Acer saccharum TaxID=4024 RepID=A0AA39SZ60_ACESA|nr:hypothetical protein LWI29_019763 [Acer saccharum]
MAPTNSLREFVVDFVKLDRFDGGNFIRWQKKLHFLLSTLNVVYVLTTPKPVEHDDETMAQIRQRRKWEQDDYIYKGHICNAMSDALFDQYHNVATAKEIWDSLEAKYMVEDATRTLFKIWHAVNKASPQKPLLKLEFVSIAFTPSTLQEQEAKI